MSQSVELLSATTLVPVQSGQAVATRRPAPPRSPLTNSAFWILYAVIVLAFGAYLFSDYSFLARIYREAQTALWSRIILYPAIIWSAFVFVILAFRSVVWYRYRPFAPVAFEDAPKVTVVIPAYNEGAMVLRSIESVVDADYPADRLEVLVIDDGSRDDTWKYIEASAERFPGVVTAIRFEMNRGKRAALAVAFERARGDFIVTIDSDSVIERDALLQIIGAFRHERVGAVAGRVVVLNKEDGLLPNMLHVRFLLTFDFLRAGESSYRTVYCCPGALTAYRTTAVRSVLDRWTHQTFLGVTCTYGEDRAMTNDLLGSGFDSVYQSTAVVRTIVPSTYSKLCRMFLRWNRSYVREEIRFLRLVTRRPMPWSIIAFTERIIANMRFPVGYASLILLVLTVISEPTVLFRFVLVMIVMATFSSLYYLRSEQSLMGLFHGIVFSLYSAFALSWILPFAALTLRKRGWMTR